MGNLNVIHERLKAKHQVQDTEQRTLTNLRAEGGQDIGQFRGCGVMEWNTFPGVKGRPIVSLGMKHALILAEILGRLDVR
jgi:hypothetical protein